MQGCVLCGLVPSKHLKALVSVRHAQVELANMNRLFFRPEQCGMTKTDAAAQVGGAR